jgi:hypothetical protein
LARANEIVRYFQVKGISPDRLIPTGRGEFQPLFPNDTPEHRNLNSRAEIIVIYPISSDQVQLDIRNMPGDSQPAPEPAPAKEATTNEH